MTPVYLEQYDLWVHPGVSGFWDAGVQGEMNDTGYYHHQEIFGPAPVIVDVGGHIGIFSRWAARCYPRARVFYIEPHPDNVAVARANLAGLENVTILEGALTYESGVALRPYVPGSNSGGSQLLPRQAAPFENSCEHGAAIEVRAFILERLCEFYKIDRIDLLKLDCEGSEYSILAKCQCLDRVDRIVGEWHKVPGVDRFDEFCDQHLPGWKLTLHGSLEQPLGMFDLMRAQLPLISAN